MSELQDRTLASIKKGNRKMQEMVKDTGLTIPQLRNSLKRLRRWGLIERDGEGNYFLAP